MITHGYVLSKITAAEKTRIRKRDRGRYTIQYNLSHATTLHAACNVFGCRPGATKWECSIVKIFLSKHEKNPLEKLLK